MAWIVDTCLLIDIADKDQKFGARSLSLLDRQRPYGLAICPITLVELAPVVVGNLRVAEEFLDFLDVRKNEAWIDADFGRAFDVWYHYVTRKRRQEITKRPMADGAYALRFDGLLTRNGKDSRSLFPTLRIIEPSA